MDINKVFFDFLHKFHPFSSILLGICLLLYIVEKAYYRQSPSNRVLKKITKDIDKSKPFTLTKVNGKWVAENIDSDKGNK